MQAEEENEKKPQKNVYRVPNMKEYLFDKKTGSVRVAARVGMTRKERKEEQKAAKKARIKELKARSK